MVVVLNLTVPVVPGLGRWSVLPTGNINPVVVFMLTNPVPVGCSVIVALAKLELIVVLLIVMLPNTVAPPTPNVPTYL